MRSSRPEFLAAAIPCALILLCGAVAAEPMTNRLTLSSNPQSTNVITGFRLPRGFRIEVAAAEPMVSGPVAIAFDENNRLYVAEMLGGSWAAEDRPSPGRIRVLEAPDDKGRFQTSTVFAEGLNWPSALACYGGGIFVASVKDILYLKDTDGDGVADVRQVAITGFGGTNPPTSRSLLNSFNWGLDNRIHGVTAGLGGIVLASDPAGESVVLEDGGVAFDPRTFTTIPEAGGTKSGSSFDSIGRHFASGVDGPLRLAVAESRYWLRNPYYVRASPLMDVISPATPIYRLPAVDGGNQRGGGDLAGANSLPSGWLAAAQGLTIYRGHLFPTNFAENAFICDPENHAVHRVVLQEKGIEVVGMRPASDQKAEFLTTSDVSFRPVQAANGPDGAMYVADAQDGERGRIYRVIPENVVRPKPVKLGGSTTYELAAALAHANGWHRDTAARLLHEKRDAAALPLLSNMVTSAQMPLARMHALHALAGSGLLREAQVVKALQDKDPRVRVHALLVAETLAENGVGPEAVWNQMKRLTADASVRVRHQLALTAGAFRRGDRALLLTQVLARDMNNPWLQDAVLSSLSDGAGNLFVGLAGDVRVRSDPAGLAFLRRLGTMIGVKGRMDEVTQVIEFVNRANLDSLQAFGLVHAIGDGLRRTRSSLALADSQRTLQGLYSAALLTAIDATVPEVLRIEAVRLVEVSPYTYADTSDWLLLIANPQPLLRLRTVAVSALTRYDDYRLVPALLDRWSVFPLPIRQQAVAGLLSRANRVPVVMAAIERGAIPVGDLSSPTLNFLRTYHDSAVSQRALSALGPVAFRRPAAVELYQPALRLAGVGSRGRELFNARCAECHQMRSGANRFVGPDLARARTDGKERLLTAVLEPTLQIDSKYRTWVAETYEGEAVVGVKTDENPVSFTMLQAGGNAAVWSRQSVRALRAESWSLMPDGLEQGFSHQNMADLLEYITNSPEF